MQPGSVTQPFADGGDQIQARKSVSGSLEEQHGRRYLKQVIGSASGRVSWRVQRKAEKNQTLNSRQWLSRRRARGHSSAQRLTSRNDRQLGDNVLDSFYRCAHCFFEDSRGIGAPSTSFDVRKLKAKSGDTLGREGSRNCLQELMSHPRAGTVGYHIEEPGIGWTQEEP
jgi:hypothetical protein